MVIICTTTCVLHVYQDANEHLEHDQCHFLLTDFPKRGTGKRSDNDQVSARESGSDGDVYRPLLDCY